MPTIRQTLTSTVTRTYPFYSGCGTIANSDLVKILSGKAEGRSWCRVPGGEVFADLNEYIGRAAFFSGDLDRKITWICQQIVREGDTALDIGANIGIVSVILSKIVGQTGFVHSFEPNPALSRQLHETMAHNEIRNVKVHSTALGSTDGHMELTIPSENKGAASLVRKTNDPDAESVDVKISRLDDICDDENIQSVRFVKIDVEGFETEVFKGADTLLSSIRPDAILFELNERTEDSFDDEPLIRLLRDYDYDFFVVPMCMLRMSLSKISNYKGDIRSRHDFLAAPKGSTYGEIAQLVNA